MLWNYCSYVFILSREPLARNRTGANWCVLFFVYCHTFRQHSTKIYKSRMKKSMAKWPVCVSQLSCWAGRKMSTRPATSRRRRTCVTHLSPRCECDGGKTDTGHAATPDVSKSCVLGGVSRDVVHLQEFVDGCSWKKNLELNLIATHSVPMMWWQCTYNSQNFAPPIKEKYYKAALYSFLSQGL